jgi:hypothetical protein
MAFFTHCWSSANKLFLRTATKGGCQWILALLLSTTLLAGDIRLDSAEGTERDGRFALDARFVVALDAVHENALLAGVPLTFAVEFTLTQPRWYWAWRRMADWFDPTARIEYRLSYHALTRQYRVTTGGLYQSFTGLADAIRAIGVVRDWTIFERGPLTRRLDSRVAGELTMQLDISKLPKPMQLTMLGESDWKLQSSSRLLEFPMAK